MPGRPFAVGGPSQKTNFCALSRELWIDSNVPFSRHPRRTATSASAGDAVRFSGSAGKSGVLGLVGVAMGPEVLPTLRADFRRDAVGELQRGPAVLARDLGLAAFLDAAQERVELGLQRPLGAGEVELLHRQDARRQPVLLRRERARIELAQRGASALEL